MAGKTATALDRAKTMNLGFGLVNFTIRYKPLTEGGSTISAKTLCPEHHIPVKQGEWVCTEGHNVARDEVIKGYPHPDSGEYVIVDPSVLDEFAESRTGDASIERIVDPSTIDPAYYDKVYLVDGATDAYDLFCAYLRTTKKAAVTKTVISKQTQTVVFRWSEDFDCLLAHVCRFTSQIRLGDVASVKGAASMRTAPPKEALELAKQIFAGLEGTFDPTDVEDEWTPAVQDAIRQAAGGKAIPKAAAKKAAAPASDLMATLTASVKSATKPAAKSRAKVKATA